MNTNFQFELFYIRPYYRKERYVDIIKVDHQKKMMHIYENVHIDSAHTYFVEGKSIFRGRYKRKVLKSIHLHFWLHGYQDRAITVNEKEISKEKMKKMIALELSFDALRKIKGLHAEPGNYYDYDSIVKAFNYFIEGKINCWYFKLWASIYSTVLEENIVLDSEFSELIYMDIIDLLGGNVYMHNLYKSLGRKKISVQHDLEYLLELDNKLKKLSSYRRM